MGLDPNNELEFAKINSIIYTSLFVGQMIGSLVFGSLMSLGWKHCMIALYLILIVGCKVCMVNDYYFLIIGWFIKGISIGGFLSVCAKFMNEITPW